MIKIKKPVFEVQANGRGRKFVIFYSIDGTFIASWECLDVRNWTLDTNFFLQVGANISFQRQRVNDQTLLKMVQQINEKI